MTMHSMSQGTAVEDEAEVRRLLRFAGPRLAASAALTARVRASAHRSWQQALVRRARRRMAWLAGAAALLTVTTVLLRFDRRADLAPVVVATVVAVRGDAGEATVAGPRSAPGVIDVGTAIPAGALVATGQTGRMTLALADGPAQVRVDTNTRLRLGTDGVVELEQGRLYFDSGGFAGRARAFLVRTSFGAVQDVGTRFEVQVTATNLRVRVREGAVRLDATAQSRDAGAGVELVLDRQHGLSERPVRPYGEEWHWAAGAAPTFALEGNSLEAFLTWAAAEGGWRVRFAREEWSDEAHGVRLHGSIEGLSPAEALDVVLPSSGFRHQTVDGVVTIEKARR